MLERRYYSRVARPISEDSAPELDASSSFLTSITQGQIDTFRRALSHVGTYFRGAELVARVLEHYMQETAEAMKMWEEDKSYAVEVFDWSLPSRYRLDGAQVN